MFGGTQNKGCQEQEVDGELQPRGRGGQQLDLRSSRPKSGSGLSSDQASVVLSWEGGVCRRHS